MITKNEPYVVKHSNESLELQKKAKQLCYEFNNSRPDEEERRKKILDELFGTSAEKLAIQTPLMCDYGFNIHLQGFVLINYNCVILDTSPLTYSHG